MRKLYRSKNHKKLCGVCAGLSNALNIDVLIVRLMMVLLSLFVNNVIIFYFILALILSEEDDDCNCPAAITKFHKSKEDVVFEGVCSGLSQSLNIDVSILRLIWLIAILFEGFGLVTYIILAILMDYKTT